MQQLVELQKHADDFKTLNTEVIVVFREERDGVDGLKKIKEKTKTDFTLAVDLNKASTEAYSNRKMTFDNFVIDCHGIVRAVVPGTLKSRATADGLLMHLKNLDVR